MSIILEARYEKKLGLPQYSSHSFALTLRSELSDATQVDAESQRIHKILQTAVDREIQATGFAPSDGESGCSPNGKDGHGPQGAPECNGVGWQCSGRQRELILTIAEERQLSLSRVEALAQESFGKELRRLSRPQASRIITRLLTA